jgi:hypothetical protein
MTTKTQLQTKFQELESELQEFKQQMLAARSLAVVVSRRSRAVCVPSGVLLIEP